MRDKCTMPREVSLIPVQEHNQIRRYFNSLSLQEYHTKHRRELYKHIYGEVLACRKVQDCLDRKARTVLDLGAGACDFEDFLLHRFGSKRHSIIAVDFSENMLALSSSRLGERPGCLTLLADVTDLPLEANIADVVFCINTVPYLSDLDKLFQEIARISKSKAYLVVVVPGDARIWSCTFGGICTWDSPPLLETAYRHAFALVEDCQIEIRPCQDVARAAVRIGRMVVFQVKK